VRQRAKKLRRPGRLALIGSLVIALVGAWSGATFAAFTSQANNPGNTITAAPDWEAPTITAKTITKAAGGVGGYIAQNSNFYVYANVTDGGNPASGVASVDLTATLPTYGAVTLPLVAGTYNVGGVAFNYRSAVQTMPPMAAQTIAYNIVADDNAGNSRTSAGSVVVDNTGGTATTVQTANGGATAGRPEAGDTITYTFSEPVEPMSIMAAWTNPLASQNATVSINNNAVGGNDSVTVGGANLGTVNLGGARYVTATRTYTNSVMTVSGNTLTIVLGTASGAGTTSGNTNMSWASSNLVDDRAGNAFSGNTAAETGGGDREF